MGSHCCAPQSQGLKAVEDNGQRFEWRDTDHLSSISELADTYRSRMCIETVSIRDGDVAATMPW
jgi:hypothetical protein